MSQINKNGIIQSKEFNENNKESTYVITGSPTIKDGIISNMNYNNYVEAPFFDLKNKAFSIIITINFDTKDLSLGRAAIIGQGGADFKIMTLASENTHPRLWYSTTGNGWSTNVLYSNVTFQANKDYIIEYIVDKTNVVLKINQGIIHKASYSGITYDIGTNVIRLGNTIGLDTWKLYGCVKSAILKIDNVTAWSSVDAYLQNHNTKINKNFITSNTFYEV